MKRLVTATRTLAVAALAASAVGIAAPAGAAPAPIDWGSQGTTVTSSAVTVRWDNSGNSAMSTVPRDASQVIPLTGGRTYADVDKRIRDQWSSWFSGLTVTVSQTTNLVNQSVTLDIAGLPTFSGTDEKSFSYLRVFQCWGAPLADGTADPNATAPDPRTCQEGRNDVTFNAAYGAHSNRNHVGDPLAAAAPYAKEVSIPMLPVGGPETPVAGNADKFFTKVTTNEISQIKAGSALTASRSFELQTGAESAFLGCGARADAVANSTGRCWLVAVPMNDEFWQKTLGWSGYPNYPDPLSPSLWAQRMQVPLDFANATQTCNGNSARVLLGGSELATAAMASWIPDLCATGKIATGYSQLSDQQARQQLSTGASPIRVASRAVDSPAIYTPIAVAGTVIGVTIDHQPCGSADGRPLKDMNDPAAVAQLVKDCHYRDAAEARRIVSLAGSPVTDLKLSGRLIAKLLTASYSPQTSLNSDATNLLAKAHWWADAPPGLFSDPEFIALNPDLSHDQVQLTRVETELLSSDGASALWSWIAADPDARAFLDGCPDPKGHVINPWYSSRTYAECPTQATQLESAAKAKRDATIVPTGFIRDEIPHYPVDSGYPVRLFVQSDGLPEPGRARPGPATLVDLFPQVADNAAAARNLARGAQTAGAWCDDLSGCNPPLFKASAAPAVFGARSFLAITDTASAARFQLPTAQLCDTSGKVCTGADARSLGAQLARYQASGTGAPLTAPTGGSVAGAYPVTVPVYAMVATTGLSTTDAGTYAKLLAQITQSGQIPGIASGQLPPGYAPLTVNAAIQARDAVAQLRTWTPPTMEASPTPTPAPVDSSTTNTNAPNTTTPTRPQAPPAASAATAANPTGGTITQRATGVASRTAAADPGPGAAALPVGLSTTALAGVGAWFLLRRRRL